MALPWSWPSIGRRALLGDVVLALLCMVLCQIAVWGGTIRGSHPVNALLLVLVTAPLAVKTVAPVAAACATAAVLALQVSLYGASETAGLTITLLALAYAVTAHRQARSLAAGLAVLMAIGLYHESRDPDIHTFVDALFVPIVIAVAAVLGFAVSQVRARADMAERHAKAAEAARRSEAALAAGQERERIARELHDVLAHTMSVMVVQAEAAEELLDHAPAQAREPMTAVQRTGREALAELRQLLGALRADGEPAEMAPQPDLGQLPDLVQASVDAGQSVELQVPHRLPPVPAVVGTAVYRVVQEALTNARKHAPGSHCVVTLEHADARLTVEVVDGGGPGVAVGPAGAAPGHGLVGMRERVEMYGGTLVVGRLPAGGFHVRAELPTAAP